VPWKREERMMCLVYGGVIGSEGNCCASAVKTLELDGPLRRRILCVELDGVIKHNCVKKTAGDIMGIPR
jgi:hypothetical protein